MNISLELRGQKNESLDENWPDLKSCFIWKFEKRSNSEKLFYSINLITPSRNFDFASENFVLYLKPENELERLKNELQEFLKNKAMKYYRFEPIEPNFELSFEKEPLEGIKFNCWIDNGNANSHHYTWDAIGLRLYTDKAEINNFLNGFAQLMA